VDCKHPERCCTCGSNDFQCGNCSCSTAQSRHRNTTWKEPYC